MDDDTNQAQYQKCIVYIGSRYCTNNPVIWKKKSNTAIFQVKYTHLHIWIKMKNQYWLNICFILEIFRMSNYWNISFALEILVTKCQNIFWQYCTNNIKNNELNNFSFAKILLSREDLILDISKILNFARPYIVLSFKKMI